MSISPKRLLAHANHGRVYEFTLSKWKLSCMYPFVALFFNTSKHSLISSLSYASLPPSILTSEVYTRMMMDIGQM